MSKKQRAATAATLLGVLEDLADYGTAQATKNGTVTIPVQAREELGLPPGSQWQVLGSPGLGIAIVLGRPGDPGEMLRLLLEAS